MEIPVEGFTELREVLKGLDGLQWVFQVNKVRRFWGTDGAASAKSQKCEATLYVGSNSQTGIAVCVRECVGTRWLERPGGAVSEDLC